MQHPSSKEFINIVSANVRGFKTNVGELTYQFVLKEKADIVFVEETFLDNTVPSNFGKIPGYTAWIRRDRVTLGGGVALCYREGLQVQLLDFPIPQELEIIIFKLIDRNGTGTLCCGCYRPPTQGSALVEFLMQHLDNFLIASKCENVLMGMDVLNLSVRMYVRMFLV